MSKVFYPRGGGGNWLSNLIWHLEKANYTLPNITTVFDNEPKSSIPFSHKFEIPDSSQSNQIVEYPLAERNVLFSCQYLFNHYLNNAIKVKSQFHNLDHLTPQQKLFELSNGAKYYFGNAHYAEHYCRNIDLDYALIFQNSAQFADVLLDFLSSTNIKYTANKDYVLTSMAYYTTTCANPNMHFDNWDSMLWLGACHAITILDQLSIKIVPQTADISTIAQILQPHADHCRQRIAPMTFEWAQK